MVVAVYLFFFGFDCCRLPGWMDGFWLLRLLFLDSLDFCEDEIVYSE
jgi:hypothetical protein